MDLLEQLKIIDRNHIGHFAFLPQKIGIELTEINGVAAINCGLHTSMFNIAYGSPRDFSINDSIIQIKQSFNDQPFAWWIPPLHHNPDLTKALHENGFISETIEHAMICDLSNAHSVEQKTSLFINHVINRALLHDFISILEPYDNSPRIFYEKLNDKLLYTQEKLFVGYEKDKPVTIGILFVSGNSAGIFSILTSDEARGNGYGSDMMIYLINVAKKMACNYLTLSASSDSGFRIYARLGFCEIGEFECFEYRGGSQESIV